MWDTGLLTDPELEIHHKNHLKADNRLENLEVKTGAQHTLDHLEERGWVINQFGEWPVKPRDKRANAFRPSRSCDHCQTMIPLQLRRDAMYCSSNCRVAAWKQRHRQRGPIRTPFTDHSGPSAA